jgi:hypothetical protein
MNASLQRLSCEQDTALFPENSNRPVKSRIPFICFF